MEQVLRTVSALNEHGFTGESHKLCHTISLSPVKDPNTSTEITMYETLLRPHEVNTVPRLLPVSEVSSRLKQAEVKREQKRQRQISAAAAKRGKGKRKRDDADELGMKDMIPDDAEDTSKKAKVEEDPEESDLDGNAASGSAAKALETPPEISVAHSVGGLHEKEPIAEPDLANSAKFNVSKVMSEVRGHTSYLTFAVLLPSIPHTELVPSHHVSQDPNSPKTIKIS